MGVTVLLTTALTLAHQRCRPNPLCLWCARQSEPMGPFLLLPCNPALLEEASKQVQSLTYMDDIYLVGASEKMPGVISSLQQNLGTANLKLSTNKSWLQGNA